jgi:hypothetical protein
MGREIIAECCYVVLFLLLHMTQGMVFGDHGRCLPGWDKGPLAIM